jgi:DNA helicase II / ATP-dependent DNA helicase PcrA
VSKHTHIPYASQVVFDSIKQSVLNVTQNYLRDNYNEFNNIEYAEKQIQIDLGDGVMVNGRMDLIKKKNLDGTDITTIVDFKSKEGAQAQDLTMEQLALYALGYQELTGRQADMLQIFNLDEDTPSKLTQRLQNDKVADLKIKIVDSANEIRLNNLDKTCEVKICKTCYHRPLCSGAKI